MPPFKTPSGNSAHQQTDFVPNGALGKTALKEEDALLAQS